MVQRVKCIVFVEILKSLGDSALAGRTTSLDLVSNQREERRQRILDVARRLIAERGFEGVTMRELAEQSLVSDPTLCNLFGGENELLFAAVEAYFLGMLGRADPTGGK